MSLENTSQPVSLGHRHPPPTESSGLLVGGGGGGVMLDGKDQQQGRAQMWYMDKRSNRTLHNDPAVKNIIMTESLRGSTVILSSILASERTRSPRGISARVMGGGGDDDDGGDGTMETQLDDDEQEGVFFQSSRSYLQSSTRFLHNRFLLHVDAKSLAAGTIPQSIVLSIFISCICGVCAYLYYTVLNFALHVIWTYLPEQYFSKMVPPEYHVLWIPIVSGTLCVCVGVGVLLLGEPGDLPYTISCIHNRAYIPMNHVMPMVVTSLFSILAGGSLGPEAPLVAICGAMGGFCSRTLFHQTERNVIRKHTLMGMAGALAAFFGAPLGGSIFALEVNSRFGVEYFEHMVEAIFCGELTLLVFRSLAHLPIKPIWDLGIDRLLEVQPWTVLVGGFLGLCGAATAYLFATVHWIIMEGVSRLGLLDNRYAIRRAMLGGSGIIILGMLIPHTMFWGEDEFPVLATMGPAKDLPYVWPTRGLMGFELNTPWDAALVGLAKLLAISFTVAGGLRGGIIFPAFAAGGSLGRAFHGLLPETSPVTVQVCILSWAAGLNVGLTRTALATTLILAFESGEPLAVPAVLMASLCSLFATTHIKFIKTQITRSDIDHSLYHREIKLLAAGDQAAAADESLDDDDDDDGAFEYPVAGRSRLSGDGHGISS